MKRTMMIVAVVSASIAFSLLLQWGMWRSSMPHFFFPFAFIGMVVEEITEGGIDNATSQQHSLGQILCTVVNTLFYSALVLLALRWARRKSSSLGHLKS